MKLGMLSVAADASSDEALRDVGIDKARGLIATLASDADNLFLILSAKSLNSRLHLAARVDEEASEQKMRRAGADFVFAPYNSTGHRMAQALLKPHVHQFINFATQERRTGCKYRAGAGEHAQLLRGPHAGGRPRAAGAGCDRAGDSQGGRRDAVQSASGNEDRGGRSSDRDGRSGPAAEAGTTSDGDSGMKVLTAQQMREADRQTIAAGHAGGRADGARRDQGGGVSRMLNSRRWRASAW